MGFPVDGRGWPLCCGQRMDQQRTHEVFRCARCGSTLSKAAWVAKQHQKNLLKPRGAS